MSNCARCGKKLGFLDGTFIPFQDEYGRVTCYGCHQIITNNVESEMERLAKEKVSFEKIKDMLSEKYKCEQCDGSKEYIEDYIDSKKEDIADKSLTQDERVELENQFEKKMATMPVTTCDIKRDYDIIAPVYFQLSNKGVFSSTFSQLVSKSTDKLSNMKRSGMISREKADWGFLYGEWSVGQNDFEKAFYIAVEELKLRAMQLGADAIIGMRQDIDLDTNGFAFFYLQMYGTAVKFK